MHVQRYELLLLLLLLLIDASYLELGGKLFLRSLD